MKFCTACGAKLDSDSVFCRKCGTATARVHAGEPAQREASSARPKQPPPAAQPQAAAAKSSSSGFGKLFLTLAAIFVVLAAMGIGGLVYLDHRVRKSVDELTPENEVASNKQPPHGTGEEVGKERSASSGNKDEQVGKAMDGIGGIIDRMGFGDRPPNPYADLPVVKTTDIAKNLCRDADQASETPAPANRVIGPSGIPMRQGLMLVHAWGRKSGDSESINRVSKITDKYTEISDVGTYFATADDVKGSPGSDLRDVCADDSENATGLRTGFGSSGPRTSPGTTTITVSGAVFSNLKTKGKTEFQYLEWMVADIEDAVGYLHWDGGVVTRVEAGDVAFPVIVNGTPTTLPAIHASGVLVVEDKKAREMSTSDADKPKRSDLYVLDDPRNPLLLLWKMDINNFRLQVTEIRFPVDQPVKKIEQDLLKNKHAVVYGIYFDYNSDKIKPESEPVLSEIAEALKNNPDWKLTVDGHTDNIGGDAYNLELSKRRSAAVKQVLAARFGVNPTRLVTSGYGESRPVDRNDTLEGRAKNRRVELTRE